MLKANNLLKKFKEHSSFALWFHPMDLDGCGLMCISDASLGNVEKNGSSGDNPMVKVFSQSAYIILLGDKNLMAGKPGRFCVLDARSHRLSRVCRSTFAAELLGVEEAFDNGIYVRGCVAECLGYQLDKNSLWEKNADTIIEGGITEVPLAVITDAKDVFDKGNSDTPSYGSPKSLAFTVSWLRAILRLPNTSLQWTATENMLIDALTKDMDLSHLHRVLQQGVWCAKFSKDFIKQTAKPKKAKAPTDDVVVGRPMNGEDPLLSRLVKLAEQPGWHLRDGIVVHVAKNAKAFRSPKPRHDPAVYSLRSSYCRFDKSDGTTEWRKLEDAVSYADLPYSYGAIGQTADVLVSFFQTPSHFQRKHMSTEKGIECHG